VPAGVGDKILTLTRCADVTLTGVTFRRGGHFAVLTNGCHDVLYDHVTVLTTEDRDGINSINSWNVEVRDSRIEASDDALSFKSDFALGRTYPASTSTCTTPRSCRRRTTPSSSAWSRAAPSGTYGSRTSPSPAPARPVSGSCRTTAARSPIVRYSRITLNRVSSPFFVRLGGRGKCPGKPPPGRVAGITFTDITGTNLTTPADVQGDDEYASSVIGSPGADIADLAFTNVKLTVPGGHPASEANLNPPESLTLYRPREWGKRPAYGFWLRHVSRVTFTNVDVQFEKGDGRPAFVVDDGRRVEWTDARAERSTGPYDSPSSGPPGTP
jgi:hypothetical protein